MSVHSQISTVEHLQNVFCAFVMVVSFGIRDLSPFRPNFPISHLSSKRLLIREFGDKTLAKQMNIWRSERIGCDYYPGVGIAEEMYESAISDAVMIINTCKNLVEEF